MLAHTLSHANASRVRARLVSGGLHRDWGSDLGVPFFPFFLTPYILRVVLHLFSVPSLFFAREHYSMARLTCGMSTKARMECLPNRVN
ncbi:hypothetical protein ARMGADRAFT_677135 [Armillaria gallica]|uniref:Uncharacterized protein n=1 Tax=Armillaria gallica TaxID=47427 RepID=A0A2H3CJI5_ARMGA|nr:hypothetical protein ARMGADRAFT_677135 [Armillaria gallica]